MKIYERQWQQFVPASLHDVWAFFSRPENLDRITPPDMKFEILTDLAGVPMYQGMLIRYRVSPFPLFSMNWLTEITAVVEGDYFIDEQRDGPYRLWHHEHRFAVEGDGVIMTDRLHYSLPFGPIGKVVNSLVVGKRIDDIFTHRKQVIAQLFPSANQVA